jgi:hypothetical protein
MFIDLFIYLRTYDSFPPFHPHKYKLVQYKSEIQIKIEIDLYLLARDKCFNLINFLNNDIYICNIEKNLVNKIKWKLPSQYDLLDIFWYYNKEIVFINLQYITFSNTSHNKNCRTAILINFREIMALLQKINNNIINTLKSIKYKELYEITCFAFKLWIEVAQKEISASISVNALAKREILGKLLKN